MPGQAVKDCTDRLAPLASNGDCESYGDDDDSDNCDGDISE